VRLAWITLLAVSNKDGVASVTTSGLARLANITLENSEDAIRVLSSPDADTLTQAHEGRRIERCEDGWRLLNFQKYREKAKKAALREYNAAKQAEYRTTKGERSSTKNNASKGKRSTIRPFEQQGLPSGDETSCGTIRDGLCKMFERDPVDRWSYLEESALVEVVKRANFAQELEELKQYQRVNGKYFPRSIAAILNDWTKTLDSARSFAREPSNKPVKTVGDKEMDRLEREVNDICNSK